MILIGQLEIHEVRGAKCERTQIIAFLYTRK